MRLLDLFNAYDKDKSGSITRDEFQKGLKVQKTTRTMQYYTDSITWWIAIIIFINAVTGLCSLLNFHTIPYHSPRIFKLSQLFLMLWLISWMQMATVNWTTRYNTIHCHIILHLLEQINLHNLTDTANYHFFTVFYIGICGRSAAIRWVSPWNQRSTLS